MKFKSISTRIWVTFTVVILITVSMILLMYYGVYTLIDNEAKEKDIMILHESILDGTYSSDIQFDTFQNLRGSNNFVYFNNKVLNIHEYLRKKKFSEDTDVHFNHRREAVPPGIPGIPEFEKTETLIAEYAQEGAFKQVFKEKINGTGYVFIISEYNEGFLISSVPLRSNSRGLYTTLLLGGIFIFLGFLVSRIIAYYISKPITKLEAFTRRVAKKDFSEPIELSNTDEFGRLAVSMNAMQQSLKRADEEEKMFLQSISHDLKTPVMVIMSHADAIIDGIYVESLEHTAQIIRDEAVALNKKVRNLLYLNTLDYVLVNRSMSTDVNLGEVLLGIADRLSAMRDDVDIITDISEAMIFAEKEKITTAFENIIDNAVRYAKNVVKISLNSCNGTKQVLIYNDGEPISFERVDMVFDKMYKDKKGNFGLGLAITKKIIDFYNGEISAVNTESGVEFRVDFK